MDLAGLTTGLNTFWVLIAASLVFFMQAGFALVEAGLTRSKTQQIYSSKTLWILLSAQ